MNMDEILKTFIAESEELLQQMEAALLQIEQAPEDSELINAIFRAAHTIKGSAGLFGLDHIVAFTHVAESVLDRIRSGELAFDETLSALFLEVCDHLNGLIAQVASGSAPDADFQTIGAALVQRLELYLQPQAKKAADVLAAPGATKLRLDGVEASHWHLSLRFGPDMLRNGMDPLAFVRYLGSFGRIVKIVTLTDAIPAVDEMDPETCYLGFEVAFDSDADKETIESAFEFVREDSQIRILPPHSRSSDYCQLIEALPEEDLRLGEILVRCGTLTATELEEVLRRQSDPALPRQPIGEVLVEANLVNPPVVDAALNKQRQVKEQRGAPAGDGQLIRIDATKLDQLIDLIGELIIAGAGTQLIAQQSGLAALVESTGVLSRLVEEVRDTALTLRMVQIGTTFNRFQRVVRDVSKEIGKDIALRISGGETELDKTVVEKIGDPLTHLIRNAMDHGIESAELRLARGKPAQGTVSLNAYHESSSIVIQVTDDGGGLSRERILRKATERGLIAEGQVLPDKEVFNLIFEPGFSTAEQISNLSGRGVGMDVVKRNITALRGSVDLTSEEGRGTTVTIRLPLTLAIIDGFLIGVGKATYVVPLDTVEECIELSESASAEVRGNDYLDLRGEVLPVLRLRQLFAIEEAPPRRQNVVVVSYAGRRAGLVVDQLFGEFQTVIKPLGPLFGHNRSLGGFTILGSGAVALILSVGGLISEASLTTLPASAPAVA
ncbi:chemotaxis protein CheA [Pseudomonas oryzihabitans]|nr:chemotaxis protein CheA [Pseudomonas psychrotolerans]KTT41331.1 chemotaxis protein CheA [Pseudomonas psychrotolerans]KTT42060.1 chemotaxis protein CheA [Pseudomonas psychrotolerans]KTT63107.1 chemotaxis protein CheA [Pseudomonas psychrotolerans]